LVDIQGKKIKDLSIHVPETRYELVEWGARMNNCIAGAGYAGLFRKKEIILLAVKRGDEMLYNLEIRGGRIVQFHGKRNSAPREEDRDAIVGALKDLKLIA
jgi:hypothetical protein